MTAVVWCFVGIAACLLLSGFFSASEMTFSSANRMRLESAAENGSRGARLGCKIIDSYDSALGAILIGNNLVNIASSSLASVIMVLLSIEQYNAAATTAMTILVIIFGETAPKIIAKKNANRFAGVLSYPIRLLMLVLYPVVWLVVGLAHLITKPMKGESQQNDEESAVEELQSIIETVEDEGIIDEERSDLLQAALDFSEISASEVMTARVDMEAIDIEDDWDDIAAALESTSFSRIPVYEDSVDNVIGVLYLNHYFKALLDTPRPELRSLLIEPCYVYRAMKLPAVLTELRRAKTHLAIVTDEYGGSMGVITMEDVMEQIVGDIWDESDEIENEVVERSEGKYELDGDMSISDFLELIEDELQGELPESESATVGGWTIESFGAFPRVGDSFEVLNLRITVLEMDEDGLRVEKVLVEVK